MSDYPAGMTLRPIEHWPGKLTANRERSPFSAPWRSTLDLLERELSHLSSDPRRLVAPSVLQIAMREQDFRNDGMPRANARPDHPGVILSIEAKYKGSLAFPCDKFLTWQDNLRAIALSLVALRKLDRYGITPNAEQYTGWKQLPGGTSPTVEMTVRAACSTIAALAWPNERTDLREEWAPKIATDSTLATNTWRKARGNAHPDRNSGDRADWDRLEAAGDVLRAAGKLP
ncbi:DnaJ-like chaperonin [Gordonia phage Wocket]|nr:DnaJ-like chaperonin [Gordonia phage Wocket]